MRLIDLDQTVFVPIVDESKGGVSYEMQMTIAEFFDKFLDGFKPEVVDAIPIDWLREWQDEVGTLNEWWPIIERIITVWHEEQEAR